MVDTIKFSQFTSHNIENTDVLVGLRGVENSKFSISPVILNETVLIDEGISLTSGVAVNVTTLELPPGDYDVWASVTFLPVGTSSITHEICSISLNTATIASENTQFESVSYFENSGISGLCSYSLQTITSTNVDPVNLYLVALANYMDGSITVSGSITARKIN